MVKNLGVTTLDPDQAALLTDIAQEGAVQTPTSIQSVIRHELTALSTARQSLGGTGGKGGGTPRSGRLSVTDAFFGHWLAVGW